jgi:hypothetical protein
MTSDGIYQLGKFEFNTQTWILKTPSDAEIGLKDSEAWLLIFFIENYGKIRNDDKYKQQIVDFVFTNRGIHVSQDRLRKLVESLRDAFLPYGDEYIRNKPYQLHHKPKLLRELEPLPSLNRCKCCGHGLGVIADLRSDRSLVSSGLRNQTWTYDERLNAVLPQEDPQEILSRYFFPSFEHGRDSNQRVAIMSGFDYPQDRDFSESGSLLAYHYINTFGKKRIERVESLEDIKRDDALVFLASHQGHPKSREYIGDPRAHSPAHQVKIGAARRSLGFEAELPWAIFTPENAREIHILQTNENKLFPHKTKEHVISSLDGPMLSSNAGKQGSYDVWLTDYLLITALPTDATEQRRVISFIGLHLTGTLAATKLLREAPREILDPIHRKLAGQQYFQALISVQVDNTHSSHGLARPGRWTGVQVDRIRVRKTAKR